MVQRCEHARLAFEAAQTLWISGEDLGKHFDGDVASELRIARAIDAAHAADAQQRCDAVAAKLCADERLAVISRQQLRCRFREKVARLMLARKQRLHLAAQAFIARAGDEHKSGALGGRLCQRFVKNALDVAPVASRQLFALRPSPLALSGANSRKSQAFASFQSRITVSGDTFNASAVSSTVSPPKYLISTTWLFRTSTSASAFSASSNASRSCPGSDESIPSSSDTFCAPAPRFW